MLDGDEGELYAPVSPPSRYDEGEEKRPEDNWDLLPTDLPPPLPQAPSFKSAGFRAPGGCGSRWLEAHVGYEWPFWFRLPSPLEGSYLPPSLTWENEQNYVKYELHASAAVRGPYLFTRLAALCAYSNTHRGAEGGRGPDRQAERRHLIPTRQRPYAMASRLPASTPCVASGPLPSRPPLCVSLRPWTARTRT